MALAMIHARDPRQVLWDAIGDISDFEVFHNQVLVATYMRPEKSKGGVILPEAVKKEDRFQGKVGMVIKVGPAAFQDDATFAFHGVRMEVGDWAVYRASDGWELDINGVMCRMLPDSLIKGRIKQADMVF